MLFREGDPADTFYVIRHGSVALETFVPSRGAITIETLEAGEVLGWSWLFPPYRWHFDARALAAVRATAFDAACLRGKCDDDPALGYDADVALRGVLIERLQWTRLRLLDVYGSGRRAEPDAGAMACRSRSASSRGSRETHDTWTLELEPGSGDAGPGAAGPVHDALCVRHRRGSDLGLRRPADRLVHTVRAVGASRARSARRSPARCSACAGRSATPGRWPRRSAATSSSSRAASGWRRSAAAFLHLLEHRGRLRRGGPALRRAHARRRPLHGRARALAAPRGRPGRGHGRQRRAPAGAARSASCRS